MRAVNMMKFKAGMGHGRIDERGRQKGDDYYVRENTTWRPFRFFGMLSSFVALSLGVVAICNSYWILGTGYNSGIWKSCQYNVTENKTTEICPPDSPNWQKAVIGLMIFSVAFGFLATVLSICGACTGTLPKKIYYFHSAGEIYFICALSSTAALIVYPVAVEMENALVPHFYGSGYKIGWGASGFFFAAALCMCLDDLVRTITKGLCKCCCKSSNSRV